MDKKRVLIANKFYYPRGGDCVVAMNLERLLKENHEDIKAQASIRHAEQRHLKLIEQTYEGFAQ